MLASDLKLLNLVSGEHLHYNKYITMTTYANYTISKTGVNNVHMKNAFAHACPGFAQLSLYIWAESQAKTSENQAGITVDSSGEKDTRTPT